jgi:hypothetical protein
MMARMSRGVGKEVSPTPPHGPGGAVDSRSARSICPFFPPPHTRIRTMPLIHQLAVTSPANPRRPLELPGPGTHGAHPLLHLPASPGRHQIRLGTCVVRGEVRSPNHQRDMIKGLPEPVKSAYSVAARCATPTPDRTRPTRQACSLHATSSRQRRSRRGLRRYGRPSPPRR